MGGIFLVQHQRVTTTPAVRVYPHVLSVFLYGKRI